MKVFSKNGKRVVDSDGNLTLSKSDIALMINPKDEKDEGLVIQGFNFVGFSSFRTKWLATKQALRYIWR